MSAELFDGNCDPAYVVVWGSDERGPYPSIHECSWSLMQNPHPAGDCRFRFELSGEDPSVYASRGVGSIREGGRGCWGASE